MTSMQTFESKWKTAKPIVVALAIGLVAGPFISSFAGWQVTSGTAQTQLRAGMLEQQALICNARARADVVAPDKLGLSARYELAEKWAIMPGAAEAQMGVASACASKLAV